MPGLISWVHQGDIKSIYPKLALSGGKNECAVTDTVFFSISQVCTRGVTLFNSFYAFYAFYALRGGTSIFQYLVPVKALAETQVYIIQNIFTTKYTTQ